MKVFPIYGLLLISKAFTKDLLTTKKAFSYNICIKSVIKYALLDSSDVSMYSTPFFHDDWRKKLLLLISRPRPGSVRNFFPSCVALGWAGTQGCSLSPCPQTKASPADWAEGPRGLILVFSSWLSPSKACVLLCLMWAFSLQRKQLFGRTLWTTTLSSLYLETSA